jgi:hypothetical protein
MASFAKIALLAIAFAVLAIGLSSFTNNPVHATPAPPPFPAVNVNVVNSTGNPVPTAPQGITAVSGTINLASGSSVNVANSLNTSGPVPLIVRDVDNPGLNPIALSGTCSSANSCDANVVFPSTTASGGAIQTVVIDFVSAFCTGLASGITQDNLNLIFTLRGQVNVVFFPVLVDPAGTGRLAQQASIYADPGSNAFLGTQGNNSGCTVSITGHLIPQ